MILSFNWLQEFLPDLVLTAEQVAGQLTQRSFETNVHKRVAIDPAVLVARIIAIEPHPRADRLQLVAVETGQEEVRVVCGATNIQVGDIVPYASPGAMVWDEDGRKVAVREAIIRGEVSPGMLNSLRELGIAEFHRGLFILPPNLPVGSSLREHVVDDVLLEADITPNRAHDAFSHRGVAQEIARLLELSLQEPEIIDIATLPALDGWSFSASPAVTQYLGAILDGIRVAPSPLLVQARLLLLGMRPINNVVDITNYVMLESGNPTHAFDAATLPGKALGAREAKAGERLTTLDGQDKVLVPDILVITSDEVPIAIAGVIGGASSQVGEATERVFLEAATFDAARISRAARALGLTTESSQRFSKGLPPSLAAYAFARVLYVLQQHGATITGLLRYAPPPPMPATIAFNPTAVARLSGTAWQADDIAQALTTMGASLEKKNNTHWNVTVPSERLDLTGEQDLVEEVIRLSGLSKIPARTEEVLKNDPAPLPASVRLREYARDYFVQRGFTETYNYSFEDTAVAQGLELLDSHALKLDNPPAPDYAWLRTSLLPGVLRHLARNRDEIKKPFSRIEKSLFEIGRVYRQGEGGKVAGVREEERLAAVTVEALDATSLLQSFLASIGLDAEALQVHEGKIMHKEQEIGRQLTIESRAHAFLKKMPPQIVTLEMSLDRLRELGAQPPLDWEPQLPAFTGSYEASSKYPAVFRDLSILVDPAVKTEQVENVIARVGGELVSEVELFDEYDATVDSAARTPSPQRSLSFHISYQAPDRTLTAEEVNERHNAIVGTLRDELSAEPRG